MERDYCAELERIAEDVQGAARAALDRQNFDGYYRLNALGCKVMEALHSFHTEPDICTLNHFSKGFLARTT